MTKCWSADSRSLCALALAVLAGSPNVAHANALKWLKPFRLQEATISDVQRAIQSGQITCQGVVEAYIARAKAYNGVCTKLVTADGAPIPEATGYTRAGA